MRWAGFAKAVLAALALLTVVGCGGSPTHTTATPGTDSSTTITTKPEPEAPTGERPRAELGGAYDHWHEAFAISDCGTELKPLQDLADDKEGIHTHADGVIHIHPYLRTASGRYATLSKFFDDVGLEVSPKRLRLPGGRTFTTGSARCGGGPTTLVLAYWKSATTAASSPPDHIYTDNFGMVKLVDGAALTLAYLPQGTTPSAPSSAAHLAELGAMDSGAPAPPPTAPEATYPNAISAGAGVPAATTVAGQCIDSVVTGPTTAAPKITFHTQAAAATTLQTRDVVVGNGPMVTGDEVFTANYIGYLCSTGESFDSSWSRQRTFSAALVKGQLINGWIKGIPGMKVGGRRILVIPPALAYGSQGQGALIPPNSTLMFVVDLVSLP